MPTDELRSFLLDLDPINDGAFEDLSRSSGADDLLAAIVEAEPAAVPDRTPADRPSRLRRPPILAVAAAIVLVLAVTTAIVQLDRPSAAAAVASAAMTTAESSSGRLVVTVELDTLPEVDPTPSGSVMRFEARYRGGDYHLLSDVSDLGPPEASDGLVTGHVRVDGRQYLKVGDAGWSETTGHWSPADDAGVGVAVDQLTRSPRQLAALLDQVDDLRQVDGADGSTRYAGTLQAQVLRDAAPDELPIGVSVLRDHPTPDVLSVDVTVRNGHLETVAVRAEGEVEGYGYEDVTVRSVYDQIGEPQGIEAPTALIPVFEASDLDTGSGSDTGSGANGGADEVALIRVRGEVVGTPVLDAEGAIRLELRRPGGAVLVVHRGPPPNGPVDDGSQVLMLGRLDGDVFMSEQIVVRLGP